MNVAFLCLGGNIGDRMANLNEAKRQILDLNCIIEAESGIYQTKAWGNESAPDYLNQCLKISTVLNASSLMDKLLGIELKMGRLRNENKNASRTLDIDILFFNSDVIKLNQLEIPHPRLHLRNFVLKPLAEIAPSFLHPIFNVRIDQLANNCEDNLLAIKVESNVHLY